MTRVTGPITITGTGIKTISLGFQPTWARFVVCSKTSSQSYSHISIGETDGSFQWVVSTLDNSLSKNDFSKVISHYEPGNVEVLAASFNSFYSNGLRLNYIIGNSAYQVMLTCGN